MSKHLKQLNKIISKPIIQFNKDWVPGQGATDGEWSKHKKIGIELYDHKDPLPRNYKLLLSGIIPRPIGFIATNDENGVTNYAPYSDFNIVSDNPPIFVIGVSPSVLRNGGKKDTLSNALLNGELTVNIVSEWFIDAANYTSINSPEGVNELDLVGLHSLPSKYIKVPHVAESAFSVEAKVLSTHNWTSKANGKASGTLIIAEGIHTWVREDLLDEDKSLLDPSKFKPVGKIGGPNYITVTGGYPLTRPLWANEEHRFKKNDN